MPSTDNFYIHHDGYSLLFNCARRTADRWNYTLGKEKGNPTRPSAFYSDPDVSKDCQQKSVKPYPSSASSGISYDRGHLVASAHMTDSVEQRRQSHYMTNIAPQVASFNRGIWEKTEGIEACHRDLQPLSTWGGLIYTDASNDYFLESHGVQTPEFWWKVVLSKNADGTDKIISWMFPNRDGLGALDEYLVSVHDIEAKLNDNLGPIPVPAALKSFKAPSSWLLPQGCSRKGSKEPPTTAPSPATPTPLNPTVAPTNAPTGAPTPAPTPPPTSAPTSAPTDTPTIAPTSAPTDAPTDAPTSAPTPAPTQATASPPPTSPTSPNFDVRYDGFWLSYSCERRTADRWAYTLTKDKKNAVKTAQYTFDKSMKLECQQKSLKGYNSLYDRGQLVSAALMSDSKAQSSQTFFMTNVAPQYGQFNQGLWSRVEKVEACYRNAQNVSTFGGLIFTAESNDLFMASHGVRTASFWWKAIWTKDSNGSDMILAWMFPNEKLVNDANKYLVSVAEIEAKLNDDLGPIPVPASLKNQKAPTSSLPGCSI
ncbi:hypothetical protein H310_15027 [Aphanomyces invadans]|uniref:Endonuclease n=2 Tax=Aphanomyces invadans TaxID=157072 RepID=A0A024T844_9STRA|nr:hypothetical protein H310_15027 [Aphanomyces invadans]ETV90143.1 hypothetical protein H310_15027 [Aphanomyces invadans]|eukprot:XP_008881229.1 hypothetical protein H310_15027 [Aphanomyces invadans]